MVKTIVQKCTQVCCSRFWTCSMKVSKNMMNQGLKSLDKTDTRCVTRDRIDCSVVKMNHMPLLLTDFQEFKQYKSGLLLFYEPFCFHNLCPPISVIVNIKHSSHDCFTVYMYEGSWTGLETTLHSDQSSIIQLQCKGENSVERLLPNDTQSAVIGTCVLTAWGNLDVRHRQFNR